MMPSDETKKTGPRDVFFQLLSIITLYIREKYSLGGDYHMNFSRQQQENIKQYGYPDTKQLYRPHLTIARLRDPNRAERASRGLDWKIARFTTDRIGVYEMGEHGTCGKLLAEFPLR